MKKLLIVSMLVVLSWAARAQATLSLYWEGEPADRFMCWGPRWPLEVQVHSDGISPWAGYIVVDDYRYTSPDTGTLTEPLTLPAAGDLGDTEPYDQEGFGEGYRMVTDGAAAISSDVTPNPISPAANTRLRPNRSDSEPASRMKDPSVSR